MPHRITKQEWARRGGLRNTDLFRTYKGGKWAYWSGAVDG